MRIVFFVALTYDSEFRVYSSLPTANRLMTLIRVTLMTLIIVGKQGSETHHIVGQHAYILYDRVFVLPLHTHACF
jgi:hypothetical protein